MIATNKGEWLLCPICGGTTRTRIREVFFLLSSGYYVHRLAVRKGAQIFHRNVHQALAAFLRRPADVRGNDAVLRRQQRVVALYRLAGHHIQPGGVHLPAV
ncbi:MAG TPA: hypothetical protein DEB31_04355 [Clostridiales bacterium]|nr:hypothetical protein [Clostridiales bacterium]